MVLRQNVSNRWTAGPKLTAFVPAMEKWTSQNRMKSHYDDTFHYNVLELLLEAAAIRRRAESKFSPSMFKLFQGICWLSLSVLILSCTMYLVVEDGNKMMTVAIMSMTIQCLLYNVFLAQKGNEITGMIAASYRISKRLTMDSSTIQELELANYKSRRFFKFFGPLLASNIILAVVQAGIKLLQTGQPNYPFEESCLGLPLIPCWALQVTITGHVSYFVALYFCIIKVILYRLSAYYIILSRQFEEKPVDDDEKADKKLFALFCDVSSYALYFSKIFGVTAFVELALVAVRNSFQSYRVLMSITRSEWGTASQSLIGLISSNIFPYLICSCGEDLVALNSLLKKKIRESKWYESSPSARKRLLPVLMFVKEPIKFHFRQFMVFNMETFMQVMRTTYSLITAIANFM